MAQATLQAYIDAQERVDTLNYGLRALKARSYTWTEGTPLAERAAYEQPIFTRQVFAAIEAAGAPCWDNSAEWRIRQALRVAREELKAAKAELKAIGGKRQLRLALAA